MLTLRHPSFSLLEAQKRFGKAGAYAGIGVAALTWMKFAPPEHGGVAGTAALLAALAGFQRAREAWPLWRGHRGEVLVQRILERLDERHVCLTNFTPPIQHGDIDMVVLGPFGVLVIEVKAYSQPLRCVGDKWAALRPNGTWRTIKSATDQLQRNVKRMQKVTRAPVAAALVVGDFLPLLCNEPTVPVLRRRNLLEHVAQLPDQGWDAHQLREELTQRKLTP